MLRAPASLVARAPIRLCLAAIAAPQLAAARLHASASASSSSSSNSADEALAERRRSKAPSKVEAEDTAAERQRLQTEKQQDQMRAAFPHENVRPLSRDELEVMQEQQQSERAERKLRYEAAKLRYQEFLKQQREGNFTGAPSTDNGSEAKSATGSSGGANGGASGAQVPYAPPEEPQYEEPGRNLRVFSNTAKGLYIHFPNLFGAQAFIMNDIHVYFWGLTLLFIGSQVYVRYKVAKRETAEQAKLGETLLDNRTRDLLGDIEALRNKDPLRLESEANVFHEMFWRNRAKAVADARKDRRQMEIARGEMQGAARGTDMSEWLGAKHKDEEEREIARRTADYVQGFHQHLKSRRLL